MSRFDEELEKELAKFEEKKKKKKELNSLSRFSYLPSSDDIAPVFTTKNIQTTKSKEDEDEGGLDFFQAGAFEDGYQLGDVTKTILGTAGDVGLSAFKGVAGLGEGIGDLIGYGGAWVAEKTGNEEFAKDWRVRLQQDAIGQLTKGADEYLDQYSVLGRTSDAILQGAGQVGAIMSTAGLGAMAGLGSAGATALTTGMMGLSGMGSGMSEAYQGGATDDEALTYGLIAGASDAITEMIFGGLGKAVHATGLSVGLSSADDLLAKKVSSMFTKQIHKNLAEFGVKASAEGLEEVLAGVAQAWGKWKTYKSDEEFMDILKDENLLEQFVVGMATSGIIQSGLVPGTRDGSLAEANKEGKDFITGQTVNEQAVVKREIEKRIAEAEKGGKKLTNREKGDIKDAVERGLDKGYISIDTIEEVLGGESRSAYESLLKESEEYKYLYETPDEKLSQKQRDRRAALIAKNEKTSYQDALKASRKKLYQSVKELAKSDRLIESYNEIARKKQDFKPDFTKYKSESSRKTLQNIVNSGLANNSNEFHDFTDLMARISNDRGIVFDITDNKKLEATKHQFEGRIVDGFISGDGKNITINLDSPKALNFIVGHEVTHSFESNKTLYKNLQQAVFSYANSKGDLKGTPEEVAKQYEEKYEGVNGANHLKELTADMIGNYLFRDYGFVTNLSANHRNVFQKIYDEVKYLVKIATAGSKAARDLERVKRAFDKAYRETTKVASDSKAGSKYSFTADQQKNYDYNQKRTDVGSALKTLKGSAIKRSTKFGVGKEIGGEIYVHKQYADEVVPAEVLSQAERLLAENKPDFEYNALKYNPKTGVVAFQEAPDFDTAREPVVGDYVSVNTNTGDVKTGHSNYIWHHKWNWVKNDYQGFDVAESWNWSKKWLSTLTEVSDGNGIARWNAQLDKFGLPHDGDSDRIKYSLTLVDPVEPTSDQWKRTHTTEEAMEIAAQKGIKMWDVSADYSDEKNPTSMTLVEGGTTGTYRKVFGYLGENFTGRILDASSGQGYGTRVGRDMGYNITDIEPYPDKYNYQFVKDMDEGAEIELEKVDKKTGKTKKYKRLVNKNPYHPDFMDYSELDKKVASGEIEPFDFIISNAVLNVIPQDQRDALVTHMGNLLADGGQMFVNVRTKREIRDLGKQEKNAYLGDAEAVESSGGSYQYGFDNKEIVAYLQDVLGDGFTVVDARKTFDVKSPAALVTKKGNDVEVLPSGSATRYSLSTWTPETQARVSEDLVKAGFEQEDVDKWIKDTNSIAAVIASDKARLDFEAADNQVMLKDNQEYIKTLDASTLCAKRLVYQGTFNAIQHRLPNTVLTSDMLIDLLNIMKSHKVQTPCGVCYVESRRRHLGKFAQQWLDSYEGEYKPRLDEITTSDGLEALRKSHPQAHDDFVDAMNRKGSSNPKVVQLRTEYRNEIMSLTPAQIRKIEAIGGLRVQSFSDFETPHLLDMMQAVMDMSAKGLHSQAYTKVPNFAWVFGDTGIKINLSLIADGNGFDADGNLAFSSTEGMDINEAMKLRDAYSKNVGTIIVGANDAHILACMADDRIDYIIPFHRSGWGMRELELMGMDSYTDYTYGQKEHDLTKPTKVVNGVQQYAGLENLYPPDYWNYELSGKENAERYLNLCAKLNREPKFAQFLVNNGDGSYSLQPDGSTDGYWKTLIDFKMYDNDGNGAAQQVVVPNFNMTEAHRVLNEYEGGANKLPVANAVVEEFVAKYSAEVAPFEYSLSDSEGRQLTQEQAEYFKDSAVRDENGNLKVMYHGTSKGGFTVFDTYKSKYGLFGTGFYFTDSENIGESYTKKGKGKNPQVYEAYLNIKNPLDMDAPADPNEWSKAFDDVDFPESGTNEDFYRALEEYYEDQQIAKWEVEDIIRESIEYGMGYDGITHIGGGRVNPDGERHRVYIAFEPEQIKNIDNAKPTSDPDIRYSLSKDSDGNKLTKEQAEYFKNSKARDRDGNLLKLYHGTESFGFTQIDFRKSDDGRSFFMTDSPEMAESYSGTDKMRSVAKKAEENRVDPHTAPIEDVVNEYNWLTDRSLKPLTTKESLRGWASNHLEWANREIKRTVDMFDALLTSFNEELSDEVWGTNDPMLEAKNFFEPMSEAFRMAANAVTADEMDAAHDALMQAKALEADIDRSNIYYMLFSPVLKTVSVAQDFRQAAKAIRAAESGQTLIAEGNSYLIDEQDIRDGLEMEYRYAAEAVDGTGNYELYANLTNPLIIEADDSEWNSIQIPKEIRDDMQRVVGSKRFAKTRDFAHYAKVRGYDGVIFRDVVDYGANGYDYYEDPATVVIAFESNQVKDAYNEKPTQNPDFRYSLSEDTEGTKLTQEQKRQFKDTKTVDENGNLKVLYHGSRSEAFTEFDLYEGVWLTTDPRYAEVYAGQWHSWRDDIAPIEELRTDLNGLEPEVYSDPDYRVYKMYADIKNPVDIGELDVWLSDDKVRQLARALGMRYTELKPIADEFMEEYTYMFTRSREFIELAKSKGFDGFKATEKGRETWCAIISPEQVKLTSNQNPTSNPDIRYSLSKVEELENAYQYNLENDDMLGAEMAVEEMANLAMPNSKIRGKDGRLIPVYHGTNARFWEFDTSADGGKNGTAEGFGIYTSDDPEVTEVYGERQIKMFANITKPATSSKKTITASTLAKLIKDTCKRQAEGMVADGEHDSVKEALFDTWVSNYVYTYDIGMDRAYREVANSILRMNDSDMDVVQEVMTGMGIRDYSTAMEFYRNSLTPITGFDGYATQWKNGSTGKSSNIYLAFDSSQLKVADAVTYDDDGNVIPLSERFNLEKKDIRYAMSIEGETDQGSGTYNVYGKDVKVQSVDDIAPVIGQTVPNVKTQLTDDDEELDRERIASLDDKDAPPIRKIQTVKERLEVKLNNFKKELANNQKLREESKADYDADIARLREEYNAKKNKNTKAANDILRRIERLNRMKGNVDADYAKRISDLQERIKKVGEELRSGNSPSEQGAMRSELHARIVDDIKSKFAERGFDFDKVLKNAKNLSTFATVDNTPQRVLEKSLGYKEGQILSDQTVNRVAQNETKGIQWLNSFTDRKTGLLAQISDQYNIKPGSKESAAAQMYAEGFYVNDKEEIIEYGDKELAADFPNAVKQAQIKGLARDPRIRKIYDDTLAAINQSRARNAYPEIQKLDNYFLHFRAMEDTFSRLGLPFNPNDIKAKDLPTDLNGVTADLKPGQPYFASAMHRTGKRTSFDLLGGLERYLSSAKNQIYHIDDIQTLRALRNYVAETYGQAHGLEGLDLMTEEEAQERIKQVYDSHLSTFAKFLNEEANIIAGKTALIDRGIEGIIGRRGITFLNTINKQVGSNMVGFNVSSSLTNFLPVAQTFAKTNKADFVKAFAQTVGNKVGSIFGRTDAFTENSPVVIRRKGEERFYRTPYQKIADSGYVLMSAVDDISTELIARTKYNELTRKGMDSEQAHIETDKWVSRLMGDRSIGQQPQLYNSKMLGILTKFQLEVRNQLDSQFYDTIQEAKVSNEDIQDGLLKNAKTAAKVGSTFFQLAVVQHLFGKAFESVAGYNPAFDILSAIIKAFGWDDDEESEDTVLDNLEQGFFELMEDMPYVSTFTGGRIPIASALPIEELFKGEDQYGNEKSRWETLSEAAPYYILPGGYGQIKKTKQGLDMFSDEHPIAGSYTDSGNLRFPVDDNLASRAQAAIFGQWASKNARDYFDNEWKPLSEKQIQEFIDVEMSIEEYRDYRSGLSDLSTIAEKADYIASLDLPAWKKNILINNLTDRAEPIDMTDYGNYGSFEEFDYAQKNPEKYEFFSELGITYDTYKNADDDAKDAYNWAYENPDKYLLSRAVTDDVVEYRRYTSDLYDIRADKDESGKTISGSAKEKKIAYINSLDIDYGAKLILFKDAYEADDTYNEEIIDYLNNREDITFEEEVQILRELGFTVTSDGTIYWD